MRKIVTLIVVLIPLLLVAGVDGKVDLMRQKIKELKSYAIEFQTLSNDGSVLIDGKLTVAENKKYHLKTQFGEMWFDGKTIYQYSSENNAVTIDNIENQNGILSNPQKLLTLDFDEQDLIESTPMAERVVDGLTMAVSKVKLKCDGVIFDVVIFINKKSGLPAELKIISEEADYEFNIKVAKFETNVKVKESNFKFDPKKFPEAEIIDFR